MARNRRIVVIRVRGSSAGSAAGATTTPAAAGRASTSPGSATSSAHTPNANTALRTSSGPGVIRPVAYRNSWIRSATLSRTSSTKLTVPPRYARSSAYRLRGGRHPGHVAQHLVEAAGAGPGDDGYAVLAEQPDHVLPAHRPQPVRQVGEVTAEVGAQRGRQRVDGDDEPPGPGQGRHHAGGTLVDQRGQHDDEGVAAEQVGTEGAGRRLVRAHRRLRVQQPLQDRDVLPPPTGRAQPAGPVAVLQQGHPVAALQVVLGDPGGRPDGGVQDGRGSAGTSGSSGL